MGFFDKLRAELVDIIEWVDDSRHTLVWRFPRYHNQIKNGAQLIVRPGQTAIFVHRGQVADIFEPGHYTLKTDNLPILSTIAGWKYGFDSPFKAECYFVSTRQITDLKWGTPNPVMFRDPDYGPMQIRAFGNYVLRAIDPKILLEELVGADSEFDTDEVTELLRAEINSAFQDLVGEAQKSILDLSANTREFGEELREAVCERIDDEMGLEIPKLQIVNFSLPPEIEEMLQTRARMNIVGNLQEYQQYSTSEAMRAAATNPGGGGAAEGMGLGMGFAMAGNMMNAMNPQGGVAAAPPPPPVAQWHIAAAGESKGPFSVEQLQAGIAAGQVTKDTQVWSASLGNWTPAGQVPHLNSLFGPSTPPPPPPPPAS